MSGGGWIDFFEFVNEAFSPKTANASKNATFLTYKQAKTSVNAYQIHYFGG